MANAIKITALGNITGMLSDSDVIPIVDINTMTTFKVKVGELSTHMVGLNTGDVDLGTFGDPLVSIYDFGDFG